MSVALSLTHDTLVALSCAHFKRLLNMNITVTCRASHAAPRPSGTRLVCGMVCAREITNPLLWCASLPSPAVA